MERIAVDIGALRQASEQLDQLLQQVRNALSKMYQAQERLDSMWDGTANQAFRVQFAADAQTASEQCDVLKKFLESMEFAEKTYDTCEKNIYDLVTSIQI